jgi:hypothetical protein
MESLFKIAEQAVISRLLGNGFPLSGKSKIGLGFLALSALLFLISVGFFVYGLCLWFNNNFPPDIAALLTGLMTFAISILIAIGSYAFLSYKRFRLRKTQKELQDIVYALLETGHEEVAGPVRERPKTAVLLACLAGYIAGEHLI